MWGDMRLPLPDKIRRAVDWQRRCIIAYGTIGMGDVEKLIQGALLLDPGPWSESGLAAHLRVPRSTVRRRVEDYITMGLVARSDDGLTLTDDGWNICVRIATEIADYSNGAAPGLSRGLLETLADLAEKVRPGTREDALKAMISAQRVERFSRIYWP